MNAESLSVKPTPPARPVSWKKICIGAFIILFVLGLIGYECNARILKSTIFKELNRYMDVESVSVIEDEVIPYSPNPQSKEHDVSFEAKLKDGTTITGSCSYNEGGDLYQGFIRRVHIDGDRDWIGQSGSAFQKKPDKVDANTTSDSSVSIAQSGSGSLESELKSFNDQLNQANQGNAKAQAFIGDQYYYGVSVAKDLVKAVEWYTKAASQGNADGECGLGDAYYNGVGGLSKDPVKAVDWYRKAADQGNADAQHSLGGAYVLGVGIAKDPVEGIKWIRKAADQGSPAAQCDLGNAYYDGIGGLIKDPVEAAKWWKKAADQGYPPKGN